MEVKFSYLNEQFTDIESYLQDVQALVRSGKFTLGPAVEQFESEFATMTGLPFAIGVGSGTDALILSLKTLGIGPGDEVITAANTFIATVGAIAMTGARPVLVDCEDTHVIDVAMIEQSITERTKAIIPVHYTGNVCDMDSIMQLASRNNLRVVEDACQAIGATRDGKGVGSWGDMTAFSLHPLKNLNVWGDAGMVVTNVKDYDRHLRLLRNHGMVDRDHIEIFGHNSRLDALQAVVGSKLIQQASWISEKRRENAKLLDLSLSELTDFVEVPFRDPAVRHAFHLYIIRVTRRDELLSYLREHGVDAKIHYPIPVHLQNAASHLGYRSGDFPNAERDAEQGITLPAHQHIGAKEIDYMIGLIREFYNE